jgi:hypothetical protein
MQEPGPSKLTKASKCVPQADSSFTNSLSDHSRITKSNSPHTHQDITPNKPSGLTDLAKTAIAHPTTTAADEVDEPGTLTDDDEVTDDLVYSAGVKDSLV